MFGKYLKEVYKFVPYVRKPNPDVLTTLSRKLNSGMRRTEIVAFPSRDVEAWRVFQQRGGYVDFSSEISDSEAIMHSDGMLIRLKFLRAVHVRIGDGLTCRSDYSLGNNPSSAILRYFSGSSEKDIGYIRRCLKEVRFRRVE